MTEAEKPSSQEGLSSVELSIVLPIYNEAENLNRVVGELHEKVCLRLRRVEMILVNDGSTDETAKILRDLSTIYPYIRPIHHSRRLGAGPAVRTGLLAARGDYVFQIDSDGQMDPEDFWSFYAHRNDFHGVFGFRENRQDAPYRLLITRFICWMLFILFRVYLKDPNCPFKLFQSKVLKNFLPCIFPEAAAPSILLAVCLKREKYRVLELAVKHRVRIAGKSSFRGMRLLQICLRGILDLLRFRFARCHAGYHA